MPALRPIEDFPTHSVTNQPPPLVDLDLFATDRAFAEAVAREGGAHSVRRAAEYGRVLGSAEMLEAGDEANRNAPVLRNFDRYGHRIDEVVFHPSYHRLMALGFRHRQNSVAWIGEEGGHVSHAALEYLMHQVEAGVCCPLSMSYAGVPVLAHNPALEAEWRPLLLSDRYDPACRPLAEKSGATLGMAMTEKQGGSDVRANMTQAERAAEGGDYYRLTGHKWFCSAPMSDGFLTLAQTDAGLSCFLVPRWTPEGARNAILFMRLKDKLGNKANASSEIEYQGALARLVGEEGRGVQTIIEMVHHTRLDTTVGAASLMRRALAEAIHHAEHRRAFQKRLVDQPAMTALLADLAIESEAATLMAFRIARAFDEGAADPVARSFARLAVAVAKYWLNKRVVPLVFEALEVHGGVGYVEEAPMARLYREAPLNSIWEGSGNVIALDVLRTLSRAPEALESFRAELAQARGADRRFDAALARLDERLGDPHAMSEQGARRLAEDLGLLLEASLMIRFAPAASADAFVAARLARDCGFSLGTPPPGIDAHAIVARASPGRARA